MNTKKTRLTSPQERLLRRIAYSPGLQIWDGYPPRARLIELGLITTKPGKFSIDRAFPTEAGRECIEAHTK